MGQLPSNKMRCFQQVADNERDYQAFCAKRASMTEQDYERWNKMMKDASEVWALVRFLAVPNLMVSVTCTDCSKQGHKHFDGTLAINACGCLLLLFAQERVSCMSMHASDEELTITWGWSYVSGDLTTKIAGADRLWTRHTEMNDQERGTSARQWQASGSKATACSFIPLHNSCFWRFIPGRLPSESF